MNQLEAIRLLVLDVDGVLTDGRLFYGPEGDNIKVFNARDGAGIKYLMRAGLDCAILSGRDSTAMRLRAEDLGIQHVIGGAKFKEPELRRLSRELSVPLEEIGYMGDDLVDIPPMRICGWKACPADATEEVREMADYVAKRNGGRGAVREVAEHILKTQDKWDLILDRYFPE